MKIQVLIGITVTALLAGFTSTSGAQADPATGAAKMPAPKHAMGMMADTCPMKVPGTTVTSMDVEGGVALTFITKTGDVAELRQRVQRVAEMHNNNDTSGEMKMGGQGRDGADTKRGHGAGAARGREGGDHGGMMMPAVTASVENVNGGARLVLRPKNSAQLEALRSHARMRADRMTQGECPMMSARAQGQAAPPDAGNTSNRAHPLAPRTKATQLAK